MAFFKTDPKILTKLLTYAASFPDYPKDFVPPSLTDPNYVPPNRAGPLLIYAYFMIPFTTITVIARLWVRKRVKGLVFGWDDWLIIPGLIFALGMNIIMILLIRIGGVGMHVYDLSYERIQLTQKLQFAGIQIYITAICLVRISITLLLYRLMGRSKVKRWILHSTVAVLIAEWLIQMLAIIFASNPVSAGWDMNVRINGFKQILNLGLEIFVLTVFCVVLDVWLLFLPVSTIWSLQLPIRTRISVCCCFIFGAAAVGGAIMKTAYIYPVFNSYDSTWHGIGFCTAALTEVGFGIVSSSMPALNHILIQTIPNTLDTWFGTTAIGSWLRSGSSRSKSGKSFPESSSDPAADSAKNVSRTVMTEMSGFSDGPPSFNTKNMTRNFSRKTTPMEVVYTRESLDEDISYNPGWLGGRFDNKEDVESSSSDFALSMEPVSPQAGTSHESQDDIHQKSWLNLR